MPPQLAASFFSSRISDVAYWPLCHFAATQHPGRFRAEADSPRLFSCKRGAAVVGEWLLVNRATEETSGSSARTLAMR